MKRKEPRRLDGNPHQSGLAVLLDGARCLHPDRRGLFLSEVARLLLPFQQPTVDDVQRAVSEALRRSLGGGSYAAP
jgi:hypothetical protein